VVHLVHRRRNRADVARAGGRPNGQIAEAKRAFLMRAGISSTNVQAKGRVVVRTLIGRRPTVRHVGA
jgi:hypothetical protein